MHKKIIATPLFLQGFHSFLLYSTAMWKCNCQTTLSCNFDVMTLSLKTLEPFNGRVYAVGAPSKCESYGKGQMDTIIHFPIKDSPCGKFQNDKGVFGITVVVQKHPVVQGIGDKAFKLICNVGSPNHNTVTSTVKEVMDDLDASSGILDSEAPTPKIQMRITDIYGNDIMGVKLGQDILIEVSMKQPSLFDLTPRKFIAKSGSTGESIQLLDNRGCPVDKALFSGFQKNTNLKKLEGKMSAFKFSKDVIIKFIVAVEFCEQICHEVLCPEALQQMPRNSLPNNTLAFNSEENVLPIEKDVVIIAEDSTYKNSSSYVNGNINEHALQESGVVCLRSSIIITAVVILGIFQVCSIVACIICIQIVRNKSVYKSPCFELH